MKLLKNIPQILFLTLTALQADTVTLTDGSCYSGKILNESADSIVFQVDGTGVVKDEKILLKTEIQNLEKDGPDVAAFQAINNRQPNPLYSLTAAAYEQAIQDQKAFLTQYPTSKFAKEAEANIKALEEEKSRVDAGALKFSGIWMSQEEAATRKAYVSGLSQLNVMRTQAARGDLVGALNTFEGIEDNSASTSAYPEAVELAYKVANVLGQQVDQHLLNLPRIKADTKTTLEMASPQRRVELEAALKRETDGFDAALLAAEQTKQWPPLAARSEKILTKLKQMVTTAKTHLATVPLPKMRSAEITVAEAQKSWAAKDTPTTEKLVKDALAAWPQFESALYLESQITRQKEELAAKAAEEAATAAKAAEEAKAAAEAAKKAAQPTPKPKVVVAEPTPAPVIEEEKPFYLTLGGSAAIAGALVVVAGGITLLGRMKRSKQAES